MRIITSECNVPCSSVYSVISEDRLPIQKISNLEITFRNIIIGALAYGSSDPPDKKSCAKGRSTFAKIGTDEIEWIKGYTDGKARDSKCNEI